MSIDSNSTHYDAGGIEVLKILTSHLSTDHLHGFYLGNILKYALRYNFKNAALSDAKKIIHYSRFLMENMGIEGSEGYILLPCFLDTVLTAKMTQEQVIGYHLGKIIENALTLTSAEDKRPIMNAILDHALALEEKVAKC